MQLGVLSRAVHKKEQFAHMTCELKHIKVSHFRTWIRMEWKGCMSRFLSPINRADYIANLKDLLSVTYLFTVICLAFAMGLIVCFQLYSSNEHTGWYSVFRIEPYFLLMLSGSPFNSLVRHLDWLLHHHHDDHQQLKPSSRHQLSYHWPVNMLRPVHALLCPSALLRSAPGILD